MSVRVDNATNPGSGVDSFAHTVGTGAHRYLVVQVNLGPNTVTVSSVTYAGVDLVFLGRDADTHGIELWGLQDPTVGTNTVAVTLSGAAGHINAAYSFEADAPITPNDVTAAHGDDAGPATITAPSVAGDLVVGGIVAGGDITLTFGETELWNDEEGDAAACLAASGASTTLQWALTQATAWGIVSVALRSVGTRGDAAKAVQRAFYTALNGNLAGVPVYDEPPETTNLPYVTIGEAVVTQRNAFGRTGRKVSATIHVWSRSGGDFSQGGFGQALGIAGTIDLLLDDASLDLSADGWVDVSCDFQQSQTLRDPDGLTRHVVLTYEVMVEAA